MRVASIQMSVVEGDKEQTIAKALACVHRAADADLVILPEIWNVGFMSFDRYRAEAEDREGPTLTTLAGAAQKYRIHLHTGSFVEREGKSYYNSSYLLSPTGEILANYRKIHLFGHNSREAQILTPGREVVVAGTPLGKMGMATCYDLRFPELFRRMAEQGARLFLICSAWPYPRIAHWLLFNRARALENQCFLISANSTGTNLGTTFVGHSQVVDPWGVVVAGAGDDEAIVWADIDLDAVADARQRFSAYNDRVDWLSN